MNKVIVTTTINAPTKAIRKYDSMKDWHLIVVGDFSTPKYRLSRGRFISWDEQKKHYKDLCALLGPNSIARGRMIAFIEAGKAKADVVASIDDDCIPLSNWGKEIFIDKRIDVDIHSTYGGIAFDPMYFDKPHFWHRGFPIDYKNESGIFVHPQSPCPTIKTFKMTPLVQENLCDGESDIDATQRLRFNNPGRYTVGDIHPYSGFAFSPINTQNTMISGSILSDFYANIPFIGRADDIWAGYLFQKRWPMRTVYCGPTAIHEQKRSVESMIADIRNEVYLYHKTAAFLKCLASCSDTVAMRKFLPPRARKAISLYRGYFQ